MWNREHVLTGRGLARRPLSAWRAHVEMTSSALYYSSTRCAVHTQEVILHRPRYLNEGVTRTFNSARNLNAHVPRTCFQNILPGSCTENIWIGPIMLYTCACRYSRSHQYRLLWHTPTLINLRYDTHLHHMFTEYRMWTSIVSHMGELQARRWSKEIWDTCSLKKFTENLLIYHI